MKVLPKSNVTASDWANRAWGETGVPGAALTVPTAALQELLDGYVQAMAALEEKVRGEIRERAESVETVTTVGADA